MHSTAHRLVASAKSVDMQVHQKDMAFKVTRINCLPVGLNYYNATSETLPKLLQQDCVNRSAETLGSVAVAE